MFRVTPLYDIAIRHNTDIHLYADDTQLYVSFDLDSLEDRDAAIHKIENCIEDICTWMTENKLQLNDDKTELLFVSSAWQKHKSSATDLSIGHHAVHPST